MADALNELGIKLVIYAHPNDGHDLKPEEQARIGFIPPQRDKPRTMPVYNEFLNEVYAELAHRYANKPNLLGFWWDGWNGNGGCVDVARLRKTVLTAMPRAILLSNQFDREFIDFNSGEIFLDQKDFDAGDNIETRAVRPDNQTKCSTDAWWCSNLQNKSRYSPETIFRFTVLNAASGAPGGMCWAGAPTADGKTWGSHNQPRDVFLQVGRRIGPIRPSICGVTQSIDWPAPPGGTTFSKAPPFVATRGSGGRTEYVHVLKPPAKRTIDLPLPVEVFRSARLLPGMHPVKMETLDSTLRLTLGAEDTWDPLDTTFALEVDANIQPRMLDCFDPAIVYSPNWTQDRSSANCHTNTKGAFAEITFTGTGFAWYGVKSPQHGQAAVSIDGNPPVDIDCHAPERIVDVQCYRVGNLPPQRHTVRIATAPRRNPAAIDGFIEIKRLLLLESTARGKTHSPADLKN